MSDWEEARSRLGYRSKAMLTSGADKWDQQTGADIQAMLDLVRVQDEANREMTRLLAQSKAALLDAQHQEAQDIEALVKLENLLDAEGLLCGRRQLEVERLRVALEEVRRLTKSASDVFLIRISSVAAQALYPDWRDGGGKP